MYPHINEIINLLHKENISSFLVTNAQFPDRIEQLNPVTQLYVSIDASTKDSLKKIDRPLFKDFWERYIGSLRALKHKRVRTVYRLTLVKGFNTSDIAEYARLITLGLPCFIEIKGQCPCGLYVRVVRRVRGLNTHPKRGTPERVRRVSECDCAEYARLTSLSLPCFIEIKSLFRTHSCTCREPPLTQPCLRLYVQT